MAVEITDRLHAAIKLATAQADAITVVSAAGINLALFERLSRGEYRIVLDEGITDTELSLSCCYGVDEGGDLVLARVVRDVADPDFRTFLVSVLAPAIGDDDGGIDIQWFRIHQGGFEPVTFA